jgi:hypothetical protein
VSLSKLEDCQEDTTDLIAALARVTTALVNAKACGSWSDFDARMRSCR